MRAPPAFSSSGCSGGGQKHVLSPRGDRPAARPANRRQPRRSDTAGRPPRPSALRLRDLVRIVLLQCAHVAA